MKYLIVSILFIVVSGFIAACGGGGGGSESENSAFEDDLCFLGDVSLPEGTYHGALLTPEGFYWECSDGNIFRLYSDGTFDATYGDRVYRQQQIYFNSCPGSPSREQTGEWVVDSAERFCSKLDNIQSGLYQCSEIEDFELGFYIRFAPSVAYDEDGVRDDISGDDSDFCRLIEE